MSFFFDIGEYGLFGSISEINYHPTFHLELGANWKTNQKHMKVKYELLTFPLCYFRQLTKLIYVIPKSIHIYPISNDL